MHWICHVAVCSFSSANSTVELANSTHTVEGKVSETKDIAGHCRAKQGFIATAKTKQSTRCNYISFLFSKNSKCSVFRYVVVPSNNPLGI